MPISSDDGDMHPLRGAEYDIPESVANAAHMGTSFVPEKRGASERADYAATLREDYDMLRKYATTPEKQATLDEMFAEYRSGLRSRTIARLRVRSTIVSWMITGRSNFPVRRMEKRNASERKRTEEVIDYRARMLARIKKALTPELQPIRTEAPDAVERIESKLEKLERWQAFMKATNAAIRKTAKHDPDARVTAIIAAGAELGEKVSEKTARELLAPDYAGRIGFPSYELTNNAANIRRLKARGEHVAHVQSQEATVREGTNARYEDAPAENRVRLYFPGKPDEATRTLLKSRGFRWAPSLGCWQAYRNAWSIQTAAQVAGNEEAPASTEA